MRDYSYGKRDRGPVEFGSRKAEREREILKIARRNIVTLPPSITIKSAAETMVDYQVRRLPIVQPGTKLIQGIVTSRDIIDFLGGGDKAQIITQRHKGNFLAAINESVRLIMDPTVISIKDTYSVGKTLSMLMEQDVGGFPILDKYDHVVGMVEEEDFVYNIAGVWSGIPVRDAMTSHVIALTPGTTIKDTARMMIMNYRRRLPVVSDGELIGVVSTFDIIEYFGSSQMLERMKTHNVEDAFSIRVSDIVKRDPVTIGPDDDLGMAVDRMRQSAIGFLPVMEGSKLVGVITERDILHTIVQEGYE
ncbi:MAG: CBS domain-containing protein [Candidatus Methanofastidiosa archaeon]|jgi:CBS domain-containing protein|nr:CBS domain-containing protein [Candidatus Methanofastidiosa archaeon]